MSVALQIMVYYTHMVPHLYLQAIVMLIGQEVPMIEKAPLEDVSFFGIIWYLGLARSKIVYLYQLLKLST